MYKPELEQLQADRKRSKEAAKADNLSRAMRDMKMDVPLSSSLSTSTDPKPPGKGSKKTAADLIAEMEEQERLEEQQEAEDGWQEEEEDIYREDHEMYSDLRKEQERRSGVANTKRLPQVQPQPTRTKKAVLDDDFGGRWPAP